MPDYLIFTDLDGTLLGHDTYTYTENLELIRQLKRRYPIILCSSKTALEIKNLQKKLGLVDMPFVAENGAYIYFNSFYQFQSPVRQAAITEALQRLRIQYHLNFQLFSENTSQQIAELTGLSLAESCQALQRLYSEVIIWGSNPQYEQQIIARHLAKNLHIVHGGRFSHVLSTACDKSIAVRWLQQFYPAEAVRIGLGDSENDIDMLKACEHAVVVKRPYKPVLQFAHNSVYYTRKMAPAGWKEGLEYFLQQ